MLWRYETETTVETHNRLVHVKTQRKNRYRGGKQFLNLRGCKISTRFFLIAGGAPTCNSEKELAHHKTIRIGHAGGC